MVSRDGLSAQTFELANSPKPRRWLWRYGPLIIWLALIFIGSTDLLSASNTGGVFLRPVLWLFPHASEATVRVVQFLGRKASHFTEYAILGVLAARAFRNSPHDLLRRRWFWISFLLVVVYSLSDEFHQSFVPSRTASIYDSMIDSLGGLIALTILAWRSRRNKKPEDRHRNVRSVVS
ncbi:MAG TPA: VanZ family protein [Pyrinomonadaceae bacterium]|nr:VanZ family protein [Pyrinomonadaceae bacterium]